MPKPLDLRIVPDPPALFQAAAHEFASCAIARVKAAGRFTVALAGGSTPKSFYSLLAKNDRDRLPWNKMFFFWGDERHVPPDHAESNYRMANEAMLSKVPVAPANVHRIKAENPDAAIAARDYERELRKFFKLSAGKFPSFDIALLGLGPEAHTASLFPGTKALQEKKKLAVSNWVGKFFTDRITMTAPVFNRAHEVIFLVAGDDKAIPLKAVLEGKHEPDQLPAQLIRPGKGSLLWLLDQPAAKYLGKPIS